MQVEFNVKNLLGKIPVNPDLRQYYERVIQHIAEKRFDFIDTSNLEKIIIPDNFVSDVIEFQRTLNMDNPSVTENEFGRAFGKMLHDTKTGKFYVFIDPGFAAFLMDDTVLSACFDNSEEAMTGARVARLQALNLLAHELAHVEFDTYANLPEAKTDLNGQLESLLYRLFEEYYACRRSAVVSSEHIISYDEKYINDIEQKIIELKWKYKTHEMD